MRAVPLVPQRVAPSVIQTDFLRAVLKAVHWVAQMVLQMVVQTAGKRGCLKVYLKAAPSVDHLAGTMAGLKVVQMVVTKDSLLAVRTVPQRAAQMGRLMGSPKVN